MLIILSGLPGTGKSTLADELARRLGAVWLRIDSIEQALARSSLAGGPMNDAGYRVGYAVAEDNLRLGLRVVADSVNPIPLTRSAWREAAVRAGCCGIAVEVVCSDRQEHRSRVEGRAADIPDLRLPTWQEVLDRDYRPWADADILIDTAHRSVADCVDELVGRLGEKEKERRGQKSAP